MAAATMLSLATLAPMGAASAADLAPFPVKAKPLIDVPFFLVNDNRVTYSYIFTGTDPGVFSLLGQPNLVVKIDRAKAARYGFSVSDVNSVVQAAVGGQEMLTGQ